MKAAVIAEPRRVLLCENGVPEPGSGQIRIRVDGCGVCGSNLPLWEGKPWFKYPLEPGMPGHEGWGVVDAVAADVRRPAIGERVAMLSYNAFAEYDLARADAVVALPPSIRNKPFPGESIGCAMNVFDRSRIVSGQTVAVVGIGFIGALLVRLASQAGAEVIAISRRPFALEIARSCGAAHLIPMDDHERILDRVNRITCGKGCERVIEAVGLQWPLDLATAMTAERGRLIIAGYHQDGPRQIDMQLWNWRGLDVINAHERNQAVYLDGMQKAVDAMVQGDLDLDCLLTHGFSLDRLGDAFEAMRTRPDGFLKAFVTA